MAKIKCSHFYIMYSDFTCVCSFNTQSDSDDEGLSVVSWILFQCTWLKPAYLLSIL